MHRLLVALLLAMASAPPSMAQERTGVIRGRVTVDRQPTSSGLRPSVAGLGMPAVPDPPDRRRSVVYLEMAPRGAFEEPARGRVVLDQRNQTFVPHVLAIAVGTVVDFPNSDKTYHNVFSLSKARRFDLGRYPRGESRSVRFDQPGVVRIFCEIHSHMNAFILVFGHRFFGATDKEGRYQIEDVPAGTYTLAVWHDGATKVQRVVTVRADGGAVELDFTVE
jgi:plastocyanin